ncbi:hypothetical protein K431DRAFT_19646 [Polychaeton citri CBS 116435]|uniref:Apple domain-containing protein n=1 Tax=Polychaeton citri CBS 116435 TaxID=1314669 RepID=A0A9P4UKK2_9PEZI|nr:hypothetical protein K431DRAFT_19646 [Polychaeton citri CBS 116435]
MAVVLVLAQMQMQMVLLQRVAAAAAAIPRARECHIETHQHQAIHADHPTSRSATMGSSASSAASTTASTNTIPSSTPTATSGTTGIAAFACNSSSISSTYTTSDDTVFMEECYTDYASGSPTWNSTSSEIANLGRATVYSFRACMQACDDYNNNVDPEDTQCMAVSYNANLTYAVQAYGGNCVFKNTRGAGSNGEDGVDYGLVASAYVDCIVDGEC